jgi:hypothetical protein
MVGVLKKVGSSQEIKGRYIKGRKNAGKKISRTCGVDRSTSVLCQTFHLWLTFPRAKTHPVHFEAIHEGTTIPV